MTSVKKRIVNKKLSILIFIFLGFRILPLMGDDLEKASFTSSANFRPAARRPSVAPFSSSIAPSAMDSSKVATSGASRLAEILTEEVNGALEEKSMVIIIPSYNNAEWYSSNLDSVLLQKHHNFRVIYIDDASTDGTGDLVREYLLKNDPEHKVTLIQNPKRVGALANLYRGVWMCHPSDIIVTVDGDDWLSHENVLQFLNEIYSNSDVWMTYGQFIEYPSGRKGGAALVPQQIIQGNLFREFDWVTTHLRTFYAGLFQKIQKDDFFYNDSFFPVAWDLAFMFPMLEMAGFHSRFIPDPLYVYNVATPLSDGKLHQNLQRFLDTVIRQKKRYTPIEKLEKPE